VSRLESLFKEIPEIIECHRVTGDDSLIMKVHVTSIAHLETVIQRIMPYGMPATSIVLSTPAPRRRLERRMVTQAVKKTRGPQS
jgi:Lrp/AsnC family leucine-responsive transcriptional regulator